MKRHKTWKHWLTGLTFPVALFLIATPLAACAPQPWEQDPDVQAAQRDCTGLAEGDRHACIERHAVDSLNPDVCRLTGMWVDDMCLQAVYQAANDPAICDRLYLKGVRPTCRAYYASLRATTTPLLIPTTTPVAYQPTDWPRDLSAIIACPTGADTAEQCLSQKYPQRMQLVGYLIRAAGGFVLLRGPRRLPVSLDFAEGYRRESIDWLCEHGYLTAVQGAITSLDPPTMLVSEAHGAAHSFLARSTPLAELYTNPEWGIAIEYPSGWVVEPAGSDDPTAIYIQNFHSADVFVPLAGGAGVEADPSLYRVRLYPLPQEHVTTLEEARAGYEQGLEMRSMTVNGLPTLRFRNHVDEEALVQLAGRVLLLSTRQDPALFDRMLGTLRAVPTEAPAAISPPVTPPPAYLTREAARQATIVARATASPFPTAGPAAVRTGQPASATTQRDGLFF